MFSERVYRYLLVVYPREHRRECGDLMIQLFRDRMSCDGNGFRGPIVWIQMIFDLVGAAFKEHKEGADMRKLTSVGIALAVLLVAGGIGIGTLLAQSKGEVVLSVLEVVDTKTFSGSGSDGVAEAMKQAVEEGKISQATADDIVRLVDERHKGGPASLSGKVFVLQDEDVKTFSRTGPDGVAGAMRQAVEEGDISQAKADEIVRSFTEGGSANVWQYDGGADGVAEAVRQVVEEGKISQATADLILRSFDSRNSGS